MTRSEEAKDRDALARSIAWLLDRPKTLLMVTGLMAAVGTWREGKRMMEADPPPQIVTMDEAKVRAIMDEKLAPIMTAQAEGNRRLGAIEGALIMRGLRADAGALRHD